jgi:type I restriction enzyme R subunit
LQTETIRIIMTVTASDRPGLQNHVYSKGQKKRGEVASFQYSVFRKRRRDSLKLVIVQEGEAPGRLWLTGFDAPCCHTMYMDKPMAGHKERRTPIRRSP